MRVLWRVWTHHEARSSVIKIDDPALYARALAALQETVGKKYLGRLVQMFLACKHYGHLIPQVGDPAGISTSELEKLLDDLFRKQSRTEAEKILILFGATYQVPSGVTDGALTGPSNIWRNNLNFQKGYMCYATAAELNNATFRNASRTMCPHLNPLVPQDLHHATCKIRPGASYRNEDHPKVFRKGPDDGRYFVYDPSDHAFYRNIVLPTTGLKLPIAALIVALYHDSLLAAGRSEISISDFATDFDFSPEELSAYFEDDPTSAAHLTLLEAAPNLTWEQAVPEPLAAQAVPDEALPGELPEVPEPKAPAKKSTVKKPVQTGAKTPAPPQGSHWWSAEQAVRALLEDEGWVVMDVSRLGIGCDIKASKGQTLRLVEVKSALSTCSPTLTAGEYAAAKEARKNYVLAIVENFEPSAQLIVQWVRDPAHLQMTKRDVTQYFLPRSVWKKPATSIFPN